jgi:UDP-glucose 4-epimerase
MSWLVTGGAGYIGAHIVRALLREGEPVTVLDDLSTGVVERLPAGVRLVVGSTTDAAAVHEALRGIRGVVHMAARKAVGESVADPLGYYRDNVGGLLTLLAGMADAGVNRLIFSSSAAVYGTPTRSPVREQDRTAPESPYGETKLVGEWLARDAGVATGLRHVNLRYFNVAGAGADELGDVGVFNLVPLAFRAVSDGRPPEVFGTDYPTPDGSCVRDYIHVADLARAHVVAARQVDRTPGCAATYNVGTGNGYSVLEVLRVVGEVTGVDVVPELVGRRAGDPAEVVADASRISAELGWKAQHDLNDMIASAWSAWRAAGRA